MSERVSSLFDLLATHYVTIPALQRNYAHGRNTEHARAIRINFCKEFIKVCNEEGRHLNLDYVYGVETAREFKPIDGQQRLTSLWILAVVLANRIDNVARRREKLSVLARFGYEGRPFATAFCQWLVSDYAAKRVNSDNVKDVFLSIDKNVLADPTVKSIAVMFEAVSELVPVTIDPIMGIDALSRVVFRLKTNLPTRDPEDLYVKVNARGKTLTQWENLKGAISRSITAGRERNLFDSDIESISDLYYEMVKGDCEAPQLPDDPLFYLFARLNHYYQRGDGFDSDVQLGKLIEMTWGGGVEGVYIPMAQFRLPDVGMKCAKAICLLLNFVFEKERAEINYPYWSSTPLWRRVLFPKTKNDLLLPVFLVEYLNQFGCEVAMGDFSSALRWIANVSSEITAPGAGYYSVVADMRKVFCGGATLYGWIGACETSHAQVAEEYCKSHVYASTNSALIGLLNECELLMHGRLRIALWDGCDRRSTIDLDSVRKRLGLLKERFAEWAGDSGDKDRIQCELIDALPEDPGGFALRTTKYNGNELREWLSVSSLQTSFQGWLDNLRIVNCAELDHDEPEWKIVVKGIVMDTFGVSKDVRSSCNNKKLRKYPYGGYYIYKTSDIRRAMPIGDWRVNFYKDFSALDALVGMATSHTMETNEGNCRYVSIGDDRFVYFCPDRIQLRQYGRSASGALYELKDRRREKLYMPPFSEFVAEAKKMIKNETGRSSLECDGVVLSNPGSMSASRCVNSSDFGNYLAEMNFSDVDLGDGVEVQLNSGEDACVDGKWIGRYFTLSVKGDVKFHGWFGCRYGEEFYAGGDGWLSCDKRPVFVIQVRKDDCQDLLQKGRLTGWYSGEGKRGCEYEALWQNRIIEVGISDWNDFFEGLVTSMQQLLKL